MALITYLPLVHQGPRGPWEKGDLCVNPGFVRTGSVTWDQFLPVFEPQFPLC